MIVLRCLGWRRVECLVWVVEEEGEGVVVVAAAGWVGLSSVKVDKSQRIGEYEAAAQGRSSEQTRHLTR